jgi:hypothetical protein
LAKAYEIKSVVLLGTTLEHIGNLKENPLELDANTLEMSPMNMALSKKNHQKL